MNDPVCIVVIFDDEVMPQGSVARLHVIRRFRKEGMVVTRYYKEQGVLTGIADRHIFEAMKKAMNSGNLKGAIEIDLAQNGDTSLQEADSQ